MLQDWTDYAKPTRRERIGLYIYSAIFGPIVAGGTIVALLGIVDQAGALYRGIGG